MKKDKIKQVVWFVLSVGGLVAIDQLVKLWTLQHLKGQRAIPIWPNVFELAYVENRGAAFGLFQNQRVFFFASVILITIIVVLFYYRAPMEQRYFPLRICAVCIMAGAWGNCIDRIRLNYVVDFFYFKLIDFPIFNVADIYVTVSTIVLAILICFYYKEEDFERILHR